MIIHSMHLKNYRCFKDFDIDFDDRLTVLVGANGAGKTAVLDALSIFLKWAGPQRKNGVMCSTQPSDVAIGKNTDELEYSLKVQSGSGTGDKPVLLDFGKGVDDNYGNINFYKPELYDAVDGLFPEVIPIFAAYMAGRFIRNEESVLASNVYTPSVNAAYENNFNRSIDYAATLVWFNYVDAGEARAMRDGGQLDEMPELKAVREALSKALLGQYEKPRMHGNPPELLVNKIGTDVAYKLSQLSDGYRAMLALVMDLARRMAQSRGEKYSLSEPLLSTPAIVLIDEVELHLHPAWQQTVLNTLMEIFSNTQFIVTTHSPQVLTSVASKHIRIMSEGKAYAFNGQTEGAEASRILKCVFGVEPRPLNLEIVGMLNNYSKLVYDEKWDSPKAVQLREKLDDHFGDDEPVLMQLDLHIENVKWERGL